MKREFAKLVSKILFTVACLSAPSAVTAEEPVVAYHFMRDWEEFFTVVQWDQRGAGKTFAANDPANVRPWRAHIGAGKRRN